jgi:hypothetical protein
MVEEIDAIVNTDFGANMEMKLLPHSNPYTQEEAEQMASIISSAYMVSHCIDCNACQSKYKKSRIKEKK